MAPEQAQIDQQIINVKASFQDSGINGYQLQSAFAKHGAGVPDRIDTRRVDVSAKQK